MYNDPFFRPFFTIQISFQLEESQQNHDNKHSVDEHNYYEVEKTKAEEPAKLCSKKKFVSKTTKLKKSLENSQELLKQTKKKVELKQNYYNKKLEILKKKAKDEEIFMNNFIQIGENLINEIREIKEILKP